MARRHSIESFSFRGLGQISLQSGEPHPEEWTLVNIHKMEKREPFDLWYNDLQANILNCAKQINDLLEEHPHPNANLSPRELEHSRYVIDAEKDRIMESVYFGRQPSNDRPEFKKVQRMEEIRLYRGL